MSSRAVRNLKRHNVQDDSAMREKLVREAAYFRAERRDFTPGAEVEDWIAAEREVDQLLTAGRIIPVGFFG